MDNQKMELRKLRDFSENLNDTFQFIKQEIKPLLTCFVAICGVFIIASGVFSGLYQQNMIANIMRIVKGTGKSAESINTFGFANLLLLFLGILSYVIMQVVLAAYFKMYEQKGKISPTIDEVWKVTTQYVVPIFFYTIVYTIITIISAFFCLIPIFYFSVVFAPFTMIYVIEDRSFTSGFNRCFALIKDNYWVSFGIYVVSYIIYGFGSILVGSVIGSIGGLTSYFTTKDVATTAGVVTGLLGIFTHIFYIIFFVSIALNYYNLVEQQDGDGLLKRINTLGTNEGDTTEEQY